LKYADVTGRLYALLPEGPERDELLGFARLGVQMKRQQVGKRPEFLRRYIQSLVDRESKKPTFEELLVILESEAYRREVHGTKASPIEKVERGWRQEITYHDPKEGEQKRTFETIRSTLSRCK
jgi:hypothetical protein